MSGLFPDGSEPPNTREEVEAAKSEVIKTLQDLGIKPRKVLEGCGLMLLGCGILIIWGPPAINWLVGLFR